MRERVLRAVAALPTGQHEAFQRVHLPGQSQIEAAMLLDIQVSGIETRLYNGCTIRQQELQPLLGHLTCDGATNIQRSSSS